MVRAWEPDTYNFLTKNGNTLEISSLPNIRQYGEISVPFGTHNVPIEKSAKLFWIDYNILNF